MQFMTEGYISNDFWRTSVYLWLKWFQGKKHVCKLQLSYI